MMSMPWFARDIGRVSARLQDPGAEIERCEKFERSVDRRPSGGRHLGHDLLGREWTIVPEYGLDHRSARSRYPVTVVREGLNNGVG